MNNRTVSALFDCFKCRMKFIGAYALMFLLQLQSVVADVDINELKIIFVNG